MIHHHIAIETWPLKVPFVISRRRCDKTDVLLLNLTKDGVTGRGEAAGINYKGETPDTMQAELDAFFASLSEPLTRNMVQEKMSAGGARNALDCALWDLEAKLSGQSVFELAGGTPGPVQTAFTLSLDKPEAMARAAAATTLPVLKLKLAGEAPLECVAAVHQARPDANIIVDANEALSFDQLKHMATELGALNVKLIEQPLPRGEDEVLRAFNSPVPLCADESCMTASDIPRLRGCYDVVNIKLDKCGGLTAALELAGAAEAANMDLMVGCMLGTSLAMAPAMVIAPRCAHVDLDGPLLLKKDRPDALRITDGLISPPVPALWG